MILIYSHITSPRLQYTCNFIFNQLLNLEFLITIDSEEFKNYSGLKINYSNQQIDSSEFKIENHNLLFETDIKQQPVECIGSNNHKAFFKTVNSDLAFDIFAATFYLLSRYEEYLPHTKDKYGRYAHENSLAFNEGFLQLPLVNIWVKDFALKLVEHFSTFTFQPSTFNFLPTYDIDMAYKYKHKGLLRNVGGFIKSPSLERIQVLSGAEKDPFDSYAWLDELHQQNNLTPVYFFLVPEKNGKYDKNILPNKDAMWRLVKRHAKKYPIGIHPSWQSGDTPRLLKTEIEQLNAMAQCGNLWQTKSRQHYIRFNLPEGYQKLINNGITDEYSMGYGSINGFRASVASSFYWYDIKNEKQTDLRIHPFCFMEANSFYEQHFSAEQAYDELVQYYKICKDVGGTLITIWHNNFLGTDKKFAGWKDMYEKFVRNVRGEG